VVVFTKWVSSNKSLLPRKFADNHEINLDKDGPSETLGLIMSVEFGRQV
jgi:hypothetical protein